MKKLLAVLLGVLLIGAGLACWSFLQHSDTSNDTLSMQRDSLQRGEAVLWPEQKAYFRIRDGHWEKSKDIFDSPFVPVATEEARDMLNTHFNLNSGNLGASGEVTIDTNATTLINAYDSLDRIGKQQYENKLYPLAKQTFQQALEIASNLDKSNNNQLTKNRINDVNAWITKCEEASKPSADNSLTPQPPATKKTPTAEYLKKKEDANKLKAAEEAKRKAAEEAKRDAKSSDSEWDKIALKKLPNGNYNVTKEKANEIWLGLKNKNKPLKPDNMRKWLIVKVKK